jgi:hypothetical protein
MPLVQPESVIQVLERMDDDAAKIYIFKNITQQEQLEALHYGKQNY